MRAGDDHRRDAAADEALRAALGTMGAVGHREAGRLGEEQIEVIARAAAAAARHGSDEHRPVDHRHLDYSQHRPRHGVATTAGEFAVERFHDDPPPVVVAAPAARRVRARIGLLATAAAIIAVGMLALRPVADDVAVSSADRPGVLADGRSRSSVPASSSVLAPTLDTVDTAVAPSIPSPSSSPNAPTVTSDPATSGASTDTSSTADVTVAPVESSTTAAPVTADPRATIQPTAPQPRADSMTLAVGGAGTVTVGIVDHEPVLVDVTPADEWTSAVTEDESSLVVRFAGPGSTATFELRTSATTFELTIDPGAVDVGYTRTRTIDLAPAGAVQVVHHGGELRSIDAVAGFGWELQSATVGSQRLDLGFVADGTWVPTGYVLTIGELELVVQAG